MTTEEKAMAYDKAIEKAKEFKNNPFAGYDGTDLISTLFPELREESEDERIKHAIKVVLANTDLSQLKVEYTFANMLAWLEKQGKQKISDPCENCKDAMLNCQHFPCEKKLADNVEPKFKEGEWIVFNGLTLYVKEVVKGFYRTVSKGGIPNSYDWDIDNIARLWTIQDAIDGDVLAFDNETIVIFKDLYNATTFHSYCHIEDGVFTASEKDVPDWWEGKGFQPATKEQRDTLMKAMTDAGYTFDFKKKELRKI